MKDNKNSKKKFVGYSVKILIFILIFCAALYIPIKFKYFYLFNLDVNSSETLNKNSDYINELKSLKDSYENIYGDEEKLSEINELIESIEIELLNESYESIESIESKFLELKSKINNLSALNERELEEEFNTIDEDVLNSCSEEDKIKLDKFIHEYRVYLKDRKYKMAKEKLEELNKYIIEIKKSANVKRINETYEEKSNENASLREPKYINGILIVNKEYGIPDTFMPGENVEARIAFENMKIDAEAEGIYLNAFSTYRSYWAQARLYNDYVLEYGQDPTDTFSAKPGFSEHQTGLAFDIGGVDRSLWAEEDFKYTEEAEWLKKNCTKYGFILRYPEGKEWITGYMHESWHFRYIGTEHSKNFENSDLTLEEYLGL